MSCFVMSRPAPRSRGGGDGRDSRRGRPGSFAGHGPSFRVDGLRRPPEAGERPFSRVSRASVRAGVRGRLRRRGCAPDCARGQVAGRTSPVYSRRGFTAPMPLSAEKQKGGPETASLYSYLTTLFSQSSPSTSRSGNFSGVLRERRAGCGPPEGRDRENATGTGAQDRRNGHPGGKRRFERLPSRVAAGDCPAFLRMSG